MSEPLSAASRDLSGPTPTSQRVDTLDVLRGFALLGILLVNIELFRGPVLYEMLAGRSVEMTAAGETVSFLVGWLANSKFLSSFSLMFGVGAAMMVGSAIARGQSPRRLLARRYLWLALFGLVHMFLLFPGDILFIYGLCGLLLLFFVKRSTKVRLWWAGGILTVYGLLMFAMSMAPGPPPDAPADHPAVQAFEEVQAFFAERSEHTLAAYTSSDVGEIVSARIWEVVVVQGGSMVVLPWVLALFLIGFSIGHTGLIGDLAGRRRRLRQAAGVGLVGGLILNLPLGFGGSLGAASLTADAEVNVLKVAAEAIGQTIGAPLLAIGYLATLALICLNERALRRLRLLRDTGRMALTGYILQSVLASIFFIGLNFYGSLSNVAALAVVVGIWVLVLATCTLWQRKFGRGPLERLWRRLTYGRPRTERADAAT